MMYKSNTRSCCGECKHIVELTDCEMRAHPCTPLVWLKYRMPYALTRPIAPVYAHCSRCPILGTLCVHPRLTEGCTLLATVQLHTAALYCNSAGAAYWKQYTFYFSASSVCSIVLRVECIVVDSVLYMFNPVNPGYRTDSKILEALLLHTSNVAHQKCPISRLGEGQCFCIPPLFKDRPFTGKAQSGGVSV